MQFSIAKDTRSEIEDLILKTVRRKIENFDRKQSWSQDQHLINRPFMARLVPADVLNFSKFERSFVTSLGTALLENIAVIIGRSFHQDAERNYRLLGTCSEGELNEIHKILEELDHPKKGKKRNPSWKKEIERLEKAKNDKLREIEIISDIWIKMKNKEVFVELKAPKPNKDQSKVSKEKCFKIHCIKTRRGELYETYFALPYNPFGKNRTDYKHSFPFSYFDMHNSKVVKIGKDFWDYIGTTGVYEDLLGIFEEVGQTTKQEIRNIVDKFA